MNVQKHLDQIVESQQVPHALLFSGATGSSMALAASQFAISLLKTRKSAENHPDIHLFMPEGKTGMHPIESIRQLTHSAVLSPFEGEWKVFILHEAEKMLPTSSNALLKTLEEPPPQTVIILLSEHPAQLLPTIRSRCQLITFPSRLEITADPATLKLLSAGMPKAMLSTFESDQPYAVFETLILWYRDRLLLEIGGNEELLNFPQALPEIKKTSFIPLKRIEDVVRHMRLAYERSTKLSTCLEMFSFLVD